MGKRQIQWFMHICISLATNEHSVLFHWCDKWNFEIQWTRKLVRQWIVNNVDFLYKTWFEKKLLFELTYVMHFGEIKGFVSTFSVFFCISVLWGLFTLWKNKEKKHLPHLVTCWLVFQDCIIDSSVFLFCYKMMTKGFIRANLFFADSSLQAIWFWK